MTIKVKHKKIKSFSGPYIYGTKDAYDEPPTLESFHIDRAFWLTNMVESGGKLGTIMAADGTGITASLEQLPAVYPRNMSVQGPLFKMIRRIDFVVPVKYYLPFEDYGWFLADDGVLRRLDDGEAVSPKKIRNAFTPMSGKVPKSGNRWTQARDWALAFHYLFIMEPTIPVQMKYGIERFVKFAQRYQTSHLKRKTVEELIYSGNATNPQPFKDNPVTDLAMCMWWNYWVNSPVTAIKKLAKVLEPNLVHSRTLSKYEQEEFAEFLIQELRSSKYGRWGTNRYDRTRQHAMKVWPKELFKEDGPMPARKK